MGDSVESLTKFKVNIYYFPINAIDCCARDIFKVLSRVWLELLEKINEFWQTVIKKVCTTKQIEDLDELVSYALSIKHFIREIS